jgi:hypothetical protein
MLRRVVGWTVVAVALCLYCGNSRSFAKKPPPEASCDKSRPICLIVHATRYSDDGVYGTIVNQSPVAFDNVSVTLTLRNRGSIVDTPSDVLGTSLRPGDKWQFRARTHQTSYLVTRATLETWSNGQHNLEEIAGFAPICVKPLIGSGCGNW